MKKLKNLTLACLSMLVGLFASQVNTFAQTAADITVEVTVTDDIGPVVGASIFVAGTTIGDVTDEKGVATIKSVPSNATLVVSFIGYATQNIEVRGRSKISVKLAEDSVFLEETVVVGYGVQKKESLTSAISQINAEDIANTKQIDVVSSLQGKIPGLLISQNTGKPGDFDSELSLRGYGKPMIVVDGIVRSGTTQGKIKGWGRGGLWGGSGVGENENDISVLSEIDPNDIESISVLKDAAATIYGLGAANGVILITTKKGKVSAPSVSYSATVNILQPVTVANKLDWHDFMIWDNALRDVSKLPHRWSQDQMDAYDRGELELTDWRGEFTKKVAVTQNHNFSIRGGSENIQYYLGASYGDDRTIYKTKGYYYKRYSINGNVTVKLTRSLQLRYQTSIRVTEQSQPGNTNDEMQLNYYMYTNEPTVRPFVKDNPLHYSEVAEQKNIAAILDTDIMENIDKGNSFQNTVDLTYTAPWLKGLTIQLTGAYDYSTRKISEKNVQYKTYDYETDVFQSYSRFASYYSEIWTNNSRLYGRVQANYNKKVKQHDIQAMLAAEVTRTSFGNIQGKREYGATPATSLFTYPILDRGYEPSQTNSGSRRQMATAGYLGRINYNYAGRYFAEVMGRYDGTYIYQRGKRWGFFPSYSLGWRISEEKWFKNALPWLNNLKFRWSDGFTGSTQGRPFAYINGYTSSGSHVFTEGSSIPAWSNTSVANTILTWAKVRMMDFGVDFELWKGKLGGSYDFFIRKTKGIAATRTVSLPDFYGVTLPSENLNKSENRGIEVSLYHRHRVGDFNYRLQFSATYARSRTTYLESERTRKYSSSMDYWKNHTEGRWNGYLQNGRYEWTGERFHNLNEASEANVMYATASGNRGITPGTYALEDRNGNGYIDSEDVKYHFGSSNPPLQLGLTFSGGWKGLDFSLVFASHIFKYRSLDMLQYTGVGYFYLFDKHFTDSYHVANWGDDPWDPATEWKEGYYPALRGSGGVYYTGAAPIGVYSSAQKYNRVNSAFLRLKTLQVGYTISPKALKKVGLKSLRFGFNATNLFTIQSKLLKNVDAEAMHDTTTQGGVILPNRSYSFSVNLNF